MSTSVNWYVTRDGKNKQGPYTATQFKELAEQGKILPNDMVKRTDAQKWERADSVPGLFEPVKAVAIAVPVAQSAVATPTQQTLPLIPVVVVGSAVVVLFGVALVIVLLTRNYSEVANQPTKDSPAKDKNPLMPKRDWIDAAAKEEYTDEEFSLGVVNARIGPVVGKSFDGQSTSKSEYLVIEFRLTNKSDGKILDYKPLIAQNKLIFEGHTVTVVDDIGNQYRRISASFGVDVVGVASDHRVKPGESASSLLLFETPVVKMQYVEVVFPVPEGSKAKPAKFRISKAMLGR